MKAKITVTILASCLAGTSAFAQPRPLKIIWQQTGAFPGGTASVEFSPDGQELASGGAYIVQSGAQLFYGQVKTWTALDGTPIAATPQDQSLGGVNELSYSPDGEKIATANGSVYCYPNGGCGSTAPGLAEWGSLCTLSQLI
jgi:WD40 repeat protein